MSSDFKDIFALWLRKFSSLGILQILDVSKSAWKHKQMGKKFGSLRGRQATVNALIGNEHYPPDFYSIISREDRIVPNTIRKLDTLLTYAHDSNMATAAKQQ